MTAEPKSKSTVLYVELLGILDEIADYFDNLADADCDQDGFIPNKELRLLQDTNDAKRMLASMLKHMGEEELARFDRAFAKLADMRAAS